MKVSTISTAVFFSFLLSIISCACGSKSQVEQTVTAGEIPPEPDGGWGKISVDSISATKAAAFLRQELATRRPEIAVTGISSAEEQVVAGYKIRLVCEYAETSAPAPGKAVNNVRILRAIVYSDPSGKMTLQELEF